MKNKILSTLALVCCINLISLGATEHVDTPMEMIRKDGRNPDVRSVFEEMRLKLEEKEAQMKDQDHPMLTRHGEDVDIKMEMLWDWNHVINLKFTNANDTIQVIPTTSMEDLVLLHKECRGCWSMHATRWDPDVNIPLGLNMTEKEVDFLYYMHLYEATIKGHYWMLNACLHNSSKAACATNLIVYAVQ